MFEIGNSLREARLRQGLDLPHAESGTKIRSKYLQALEDEDFAVLPAETYVKGFLRTYAEYLGLDGQIYVDEFTSRFARSDEPAPSQPRARRQRSRSAESNFVVVALAGIVAVTVLVVVAWQFGTGPSSGPTEIADLLGGETVVAPAGTEPSESEAAATVEKPKPKPKAKMARLVITAARGDCWVEAHAGSASGALLYSGTLEAGESLPLRKKRLWLQVGAGDNLDASLNGKKLASFPGGSTTVVVTAKGVHETVA